MPRRALLLPGPRLGAPSFPMAGHLASDFAFSPPPGGGGDGPGGPEPGWVDPRTWLSFQGPPGGSGIGPGLGPGAEVWGIPSCPPPYEFCGGMAYCGPQVGVGLVPQGGLETPQPEGEAGARVESSSEGASPEPCAAPPGAVKLDKEKLKQNPEEEASEVQWGRGVAREGEWGLQLPRPGTPERSGQGLRSRLRVVLGPLKPPESKGEMGTGGQNSGSSSREGRAGLRGVGSWPRLALLPPPGGPWPVAFHFLGLTVVQSLKSLPVQHQTQIGCEPLLLP